MTWTEAQIDAAAKEAKDIYRLWPNHQPGVWEDIARAVLATVEPQRDHPWVAVASQLRAKARALDAAADVLEGK